MDLSGLNEQQRLAVECTEGPLLILAGAGSGKTRVLTYRVAHLIIDKSVPPWQIMAITFTNKAAREMKERVESLAPNTEDAWISTFHSACSRILRRDIDKLGYTRNFTIYDDDDQMTIIKELLKSKNVSDKDYPPRTVKTVIGDAKNNMLSPDEYFEKSGKDFRSQVFHDLYSAYEEKLRVNNALDFDDLLIKTLELFVMHPPVLETYQSRFKYIHVDEYQDTNAAQYMFIKLLCKTHENLCVVGDDDQSIYGWRGADLRNILDFEKDFPNTTTIKLEQNYRSTNIILEAANQVIAHNVSRKDKRLWSTRQEGEPVSIYNAIDEQDEASWLCKQIKSLHEKGHKYSDIGVLYRLNAQSRVPEEAFVKSGLPYRIWGGLRFYDRKEIKDIIAYLRAIANPNDDISLRRIINEPKRAIGRTTVDEIMRAAADTGRSMFEIVITGDEAKLASRAKTAVTQFSELMNDLIVQSELMPILDFVPYLIEKTGIEAQYQKETTEDAQARIENIHEFVAAAKEYVDRNPEATLESFLENIALVSDIDGLTDENMAVTLMTVHSAKGLEFGAVFVLGMEEGSFPHQRALEDESQMEEERRLCYVAMTRAKDLLFMSHTQRRLVFNEYRDRTNSRFLEEIPPRLIKQEGNAKRQQQRQQQRDGDDIFWDEPQRKMPISRSIRPKVKPQPNIDSIPGVQKGIFVPSKARMVVAAPELDLEAGDQVTHPKFGEGTVVNIRKVQSDSYITVDFEEVGTKELSSIFAQLVKLTE